MKRVLILLVLVIGLALPAQAHAAIVTVPFSEFGSGAVVINYDRNDGNGNVLRFRCINNSPYPAWLAVYNNGALLGQATCPANGTYEVNIPGVTVRYVCIPDPPWEDDCGLQMGGYVFMARWPAE